MTNPVKHIIPVIFFLISSAIHPQDYTIRNIEINTNGESHKDINVLHIDNDGFLWYSTNNGVVKNFDTHGVLSTFLDENGTNPPKIGFTIFTDSQRRMWVSTQTGIFVSDKGLNDSFNKIKFSPFLRGENLSGNSFLEDCDGNVWITGKDNLILKIDTSLKTTEYRIEALRPTYALTDYYKREFLFFEKLIDCNKILCRQGRKLFVLEKGEIDLIADYTSSKKFTINDYFHPEWALNGGDGILITANGELLPKSQEIQYQYNGRLYKSHVFEDLDIQVINLPFQEMIAITEANNPILKGYADLISLDKGGKSLSFFKMVLKDGHYILTKTNEIQFSFWIEDLIIDKRDIIYVSNYDRILKIKFNRNNFDRILYDKGTSVISTRGLLELPNKDILAATYSGVFKLNPPIKDSGSPFKSKNVFPQLNYIRSFAKVNDSTAFCLGDNRLLSEINFLTEEIIAQYHFDKDWELGQLRYYDIIKHSDSILYLAGNFGLQEFNIRQKTFSEIPLSDIEKDRELFIRDIHKAKDKLYIGTDKNGLFIKDLVANTILHLNNNKTNGGLILPTNKIYTILVDNQENLWLGTDKGVVQIDRELKIKTTIDGKDGLSNLNIVGILEDADQNIWFSTYDGLYKYTEGKKDVTAFYLEDGLSFNDFNQNAYFKNSSNTLFFGGIRGLIAFDNVDDLDFPFDLRIFPTKFEYYDDNKKMEVELEVLDSSSYSFNLPYSKNSFSASYSINDCYNTSINKYAYTLEGLTDDWVDLGNQATLRLFSIPPGEYVLRIKGFNPLGIETSNELRYDIHVAQVFYKQAWFLLLGGFLTIALLLLLALRYTVKAKRKYALNLALIELERKTLISQMNPHFIFNALNEIRNRLRSGKTKGLGNYVTLFSKLARLTLDVTRNERIQLSKEIDFIKSYIDLSNIDNDSDIKLTIEHEPSIGLDELVIPPMILQPIIENSIVHGFTENQPEKRIALKIENSSLSEQLVFTVEDNGLGIATTKRTKDEQHQSYASQILQERLNLMNQINQRNGEYEIKFQDLNDEQRKGTRVTVKIPYARL